MLLNQNCLGLNTSKIMFIKLCIALIFLSSLTVFCQEDKDVIWHRISDKEISGKLDAEGTGTFQRFPNYMKEKVRKHVWQLSQNSAGLYMDFQTNDNNINIRYVVEKRLQGPHMPATGVSGIDLCVLGKQGQWKWVRGKYSFKDTITFKFSDIRLLEKESHKNYRLYFPLYNNVKWMEIGISKKSILENQNFSNGKPIVVYGTSIVQGACASRPGMAWPAILGRKLKYPIINLGFSGNGRLEPEIIDFVSDANASIYILDCMANFTTNQGLSEKDAESRILESVKNIRIKRPNVPILLIEHAGYSDGDVQPLRKDIYIKLNEATQRAFNRLTQQRIPHVFLLSKAEIGLDDNDFVDGSHPNDRGMVKYADALFDEIVNIMKSNR